ncbi:MAG: SPOR domain-containing protein [Kofleriaceae bacterium]
MIVCTVFVIGVIVGKRVEARAHGDRGGGAVGDPLAALDRLEADAPLSFRSALRGGPSAGGAVDAEIAAIASAQQAAGGAPASAGAQGARGDEEDRDVAKAAKAKAAAEAEASAQAQAAEAKAKAAEAKAAEAKAAEAKAAASARAKAEAKAAEAKAEAKDKKARAAKGTFTLQLSSFQERGEAETFLVELRSAGYAPFVVAAQVEGKGMFYRVRLGSYASYEDAVKAKEDFERKVHRIAYVTRQ